VAAGGPLVRCHGVPISPGRAFRPVDAIGIAHRRIPPSAGLTVDEAEAGAAARAGRGTAKSLFIKDTKDGFWLAVMLEDAAST